MTILFCSLFVSAAVLSYLLTWVVLRKAADFSLLDYGGHRALHEGAVPRGGGLAIIAVVIFFQVGWGLLNGAPEIHVTFAWIIASAVGSLGLLDDFSDLPITPRLLAQGLAAASLLAISFPTWAIGEEWKFVIGIPLIIWVINAANFMDGSDGLLASQALAIFLGFLICHAPGSMQPEIYNFLCLAGACTGFLMWNWSPAKVFMGDAGSYFIGISLVLACAFSLKTPGQIYATLILMTPLLCDASLTLVTRVMARKAFWRPHREHLYQQLVLSGLKHNQVAVIYFGIAIAVFLPLGVYASRNIAMAPYCLGISTVLASTLWGIVRIKAQKKLIKAGPNRVK